MAKYPIEIRCSGCGKKGEWHIHILNASRRVVLYQIPDGWFSTRTLGMKEMSGRADALYAWCSIDCIDCIE